MSQTPSGKKLPVYLLAAPIGEHITDISTRVVQLIGRLEMLIVEDTGATNSHDLVEILKARNIITPAQELVALTGSNHPDACLARVDEFIRAGKPFGMMADSGICCFIDPGMYVVRHLLDHHADEVELIPVGASSAMDAAIMISGVDCSNFVFMGHYPETFQWYPEMTKKGVPAMAYVRGDSLRTFWDAARKEFGSSSKLCVSVFKNIRSKGRNTQARFLLSETPDCLDAMADGVQTDRGTFSNNFVAIVHRPWLPPDM